jgi:hypothetical protein
MGKACRTNGGEEERMQVIGEKDRVTRKIKS